MNVLVTGGSGFIGSHIVDKLLAAKHNVRVLDIKKPVRGGDIDFIKGDITSEKDIAKSLKGVDTVCHIAAFADINLVKENPMLTVKYNILGTAMLLEGSREQKIKRFILASTVYAYDQRGHLYTTSKVASELLCRNYRTLYGLPYTILRYGTAYGPRTRGDDVVSIFVQKALSGDKLVIYGTGEQRRNFTYVEDLAAGTVAALAPVGENKTFTLVNKRAISIRELAEIVKKTVNDKITVTYDKSRQDDYLGEVPEAAELEKQCREIGWQPSVNILDGIKKYVEWLKAADGK